MLGVVLGITHPTKNRQFLPSLCFHSSIVRIMHICKGGVRGMCQVGPLRGTPSSGEVALGAQAYSSRPGSLELGPAWSGSMSSPRRPPLRQCSQVCPWEPVKLSPPGSRDRTPAHVWPWSLAQSWHAWMCVYFCSPECPEQEPAFADSSVVSEGFPGDASGKGPTC